MAWPQAYYSLLLPWTQHALTFHVRKMEIKGEEMTHGSRLEVLGAGTKFRDQNASLKP